MNYYLDFVILGLYSALLLESCLPSSYINIFGLLRYYCEWDAKAAIMLDMESGMVKADQSDVNDR